MSGLGIKRRSLNVRFPLASRAGFLVQRGFALPTECRSKSEHLATAYVNDYAHLIFCTTTAAAKHKPRCEPALKP